MIIGIASPISTVAFKDHLYPEYAQRVKNLSNDSAPAVTTLCKEFLKLGHNVVIFTLDNKISTIEVFKGENLTMIVGPDSYNNRVVRGLSPILGLKMRTIRRLFDMNTEKLDVLSVHWTREYAMVARRFTRQMPVFVTVRDIIPYIISQQKLSIHSYQWGCIWLMNEMVMKNKKFKFIANSKYTADQVNRYWKRIIPIIPNPLDDAFFNVKHLSEFRKAPYIITTISMSQPDDKRKNIRTLVEAFAIVRMKMNAQLNLVGVCFNENNVVIQQWQREGLLEGVNLLGAQSHEEVINILTRSHLMVHPSLEETFGNTLIESMAAGCPPLGGEESGAVPWVLNYGDAGYICDVTSRDKLALAIERILSNPDKLEEMSTVAKQYCKLNYSSKSTAVQYVQLFEKSCCGR